MIGSPSRRHVLATLGAAAVSLAGCSDPDDEEPESPESSQEDDGEADDSGGGADDASDDDETETETETDRQWPAIEAGELLSDFEELDRWEALAGRIEPDTEEARVGSQAAIVESDEGIAAASFRFPEPLDFGGWDTSLAIKPEEASRIEVEFLAPTYDERLTSVRFFPQGYDDWLRIDCGYEHKPADEPDLSAVSGINLVAVGPDDEPPRVVVDDLRRTRGLETGAAILVHYGGLDSHRSIAAEALGEREWPAAVAVDPSRIGEGGRMDLDELRELRDRGWDVGSSPGSGDLAGESEEDQRRTIEQAREYLVERGFERGARHFFAPEWRRLEPTTHAVIRESHETGFVFGGCPTGAPPTGIHVTPMMWGPDLHNGVRRHVNLADQYGQLTVLHIPRIVDGEGEGMPVEDYEHLLDHIEQRGLDVITPSDLIDGTLDLGGDGEEGTRERPDGTVFERGESHSFEGSGPERTDEFDLDEGLLRARFAHEGAFAVGVEGEASGDVLARADGDGTGESVLVVSGGSYRLDVEADDDWTIDLAQPSVDRDDLADLPVSDSGTGPSFVGPLWTEGNVRVVAAHDGDGAFVVDGHGADGSREQLINREGEVDASRSYSAGGVVWIAVEADGDWTLDVGTATQSHAVVL
ncbi:polysaccharide deacetylase family protein [Natronorarus salvus]|uniref:polysaccharide deacetylase family protein n=1 Tax=Natronorarus salvus TaxID=3117733 RepID=UPI002F25ED07